MLRHAAHNCRNANVCFLRQDIRCLALPSRVDLITANFDTLNHLQTPGDLRRAFRRVAANLRPGGHFYFDILTPCQPAKGYEVFTRDHCTTRSWLHQRIQWEPRTRLIRITALQRRADCLLPVVECVTERAYSPREIGRWLVEAGFKIRGVHDAETLRAANPAVRLASLSSHKKRFLDEASDRLHFGARKRDDDAMSAPNER